MAKLSVDSKSLNRKIIDRYPDYGIRGRDGCVVMSEMHLFLNTKTKAKILGRVTNVADSEGLTNASVVIIDKLGKNYIVASDILGNFEVKLTNN